MRGSRAVAAALALSSLLAGAALAGEWRGRIDEVSREQGWLEAGGERVYASEDQLNGVIEGSSYTVRWTTEDGRNVASQITQESTGD